MTTDHRHPGRRSIGHRELLQNRQRIGEIKFEAAKLARRQHAKNADASKLVDEIRWDATAALNVCTAPGDLLPEFACRG
jgi:hypothetical protein